jgi:hypothetical protein
LEQYNIRDQNGWDYTSGGTTTLILSVRPHRRIANHQRQQLSCHSLMQQSWCACLPRRHRPRWLARRPDARPNWIIMHWTVWNYSMASLKSSLASIRDGEVGRYTNGTFPRVSISSANTAAFQPPRSNDCRTGCAPAGSTTTGPMSFAADPGAVGRTLTVYCRGRPIRWRCARARPAIPTTRRLNPISVRCG